MTNERHYGSQVLFVGCVFTRQACRACLAVSVGTSRYQCPRAASAMKVLLAAADLTESGAEDARTRVWYGVVGTGRRTNLCSRCSVFPPRFQVKASCSATTVS